MPAAPCGSIYAPSVASLMRNLRVQYKRATGTTVQHKLSGHTTNWFANFEQIRPFMFSESPLWESYFNEDRRRKKIKYPVGFEPKTSWLGGIYSTTEPQLLLKAARMCGGERCRPEFEGSFILPKIGEPMIFMSMTDHVQIQSVTASLSYECI